MNSVLYKISETKDSTISSLMLDGVHCCFILEDGFRLEKVYGKTRIYDNIVFLRATKNSRFYPKYKKRFGHEYAIEVYNTQQFTNIRVHIGNKVTQTEGCLLTGTGAVIVNGRYETRNSVDAYMKLYEKTYPILSQGKSLKTIISR